MGQQLNKYDNELYEKEAEDADAREGRIKEFTDFKIKIDQVGEKRLWRRTDEQGDLAWVVGRAQAVGQILANHNIMPLTRQQLVQVRTQAAELMQDLQIFEEGTVKGLQAGQL